jgi:NADH:ubiquinone oxidoreductase subunit 2 (subunit N)
MNLSHIEYTSIQRFFEKMLKSVILLENFSSFESFGFSLIFFNILIYIISLATIFFVFFFFNLNSFLNLSNIKIFSSSSFFYMVIILTLLSLIGMPPLLGFVGKFLMVIFVNLKTQFLIFLIFVLLNLLMIYFYIQNFRFLVKKSNSTEFISFFKTNELNLNIIKILIFFLFFTTFGIFFFDDFFLIINSLLFF